MTSVESTSDEWFWSRVDVRGPDECWSWAGGVKSGGYGQVRHAGTTWPSHRLAYHLAGKPLIPGEHVDHLCHDSSQCQAGSACPHRRCCNPAHLESKTARANNARSGSPSALNALVTKCPHGHPYDSENTYTDKRGRRSCKTCTRIRVAQYCRDERGKINARRRERYAEAR